MGRHPFGVFRPKHTAPLGQGIEASGFYKHTAPLGQVEMARKASFLKSGESLDSQ